MCRIVPSFININTIEWNISDRLVSWVLVGRINERGCCTVQHANLDEISPHNASFNPPPPPPGVVTYFAPPSSTIHSPCTMNLPYIPLCCKILHQTYLTHKNLSVTFVSLMCLLFSLPGLFVLAVGCRGFRGLRSFLQLDCENSRRHCLSGRRSRRGDLATACRGTVRVFGLCCKTALGKDREEVFERLSRKLCLISV